VVNVVGCLLLGYVAARLTRAAHQAVLWRDGLGTGFCGGLTTFSTLMVEVVEMLRRDRIVVAAVYVAVSLALGFAAYELGRRLGHRLATDVSPPLEVAPRA
jgi:fluoride exporter